MRLKLLALREPLFILRISFVIVRFQILLWLYGPEKLPGLSRNGPLDCFVLDYVPDKGFCCPVVVTAADSEEESSAHLWWAKVVLMAGHPHRIHLVAGTYRSPHQVVGLRPA